MILNGGKNMGLTYLVNEDQVIIATAFAQLVLGGKIDPAMKNYARTAIKREMLPLITRNFGNQGQQNAHNEKLAKLQKAIRQAP
jgi:uncharacterized protein YfeS